MTYKKMERTMGLSEGLLIIGRDHIERYFFKHPDLDVIEFHPRNRVVLRFRDENID